MLDVIKKLARSGTTLVVVTHEIGFAREVADQVVFMVEGKIIEQGSSDAVLNHPQHQRTRQFYQRCWHEKRIVALALGTLSAQAQAEIDLRANEQPRR